MLRRIVHKLAVFREVRRQDGFGAAFKVARNSLRDSVVYRTRRVLEVLHLRRPRPRLEWRRPAASQHVLSVVVPVFDTPEDVLRECLDSVVSQKHEAWELCVCDDCSSNRRTIDVLREYRGSDPRIRIVRAPRNLGIAGATNLAAEQASGEFLALLDHDDRLHPYALAEIAAAVERLPDIDLVYTDEDKIEADGSHSEPYYKPDWSPDHLTSVMYLLHCLAVRKALFWKLGGLRSRYDGAQDYDLALRASRQARRIHHIPRILYHWRKIPGSAAAVVDAKPDALTAGRRALEDYAAGLEPPASVEDGLLPGTFRLRRSLAHRPDVSLVILSSDPEVEVPGRGRIRVLQNFVRSVVERSTYGAYRLVVVDDGELCDETIAVLDAAGATRATFHDPQRSSDGFNFARKANYALSLIETDLVILLNDDLEVVSPGWIEALLEPLMDPDVAFVGARLLYPDGRIQHAGLVLGVVGPATHAFYGRPGDAVGYNAFTHVIRNYSAVTGAALATRTATLRELGPMDEALAHDYNDTDFCLRAVERGYRVVYTPFAELLHFEGATLRRRAQDPAEVAVFSERWEQVIARDPFYNPNLPRDRADYVV